MTTEEVLKILEARGIAVELTPSGPAIRGKTSEATPALLRVLKLHREGIVAKLKPPPRREWLWGLSGHRYVADEYDLPEPWHPTGAFWWRVQGETTWRAVPGRPGEQTPLPEG